MKKLLILVFAFFTLSSFSKAEVKSIIEGNLNAKIKLVVFESLTCSHCANFHKNVYPNLKADFIDKGLIYIEFRNFPLDLAAFNASKIAHCKNDGKSEILHFLYSKQNEWVKGSSIEEANNNLKKVLEKQQLNLDFEKCIADKSIEDHILEDRIEGVKKYKVNATPTLIINEEKFENPSDYKKLKKYIEKMI